MGSPYFGYVDQGKMDVLCVKGLLLDEIENAPFVMIDPDVRKVSYRDKVISLIEVLLLLMRAWGIFKQKCPSISEATLMLELARMLAAVDEGAWYKPDESSKALMRLVGLSLGQMRHLQTNHLAWLEVKENIETLRKSVPALNVVQEKHGGRSFFITKGHRLGTAWPGTRKGDKICVLFGSKTPIILRQEEEHWMVVGDAYLHGAMAVGSTVAHSAEDK